MFLRLSVFFCLLLFSACHTARHYLESGDYDAAVEYSAGRLRGKSRKSPELVRTLELAFRRAQERDLEEAHRMEREDRPEYYDRINALYRQIRSRQQLVRPLLPLVAKDGYRARIEFVNVENAERGSREKAAEHLYQQAETKLKEAEKGDRQAAREAHALLKELEKKYFKHYKDKERLLQDARSLGTTIVLFDVQNPPNRVLPASFAERLRNIGKTNLDEEWVSYYFDNRPGLNPDYRVLFRVRQVEISPERVRERLYADEKEIQDGKEYVLDAKGNVLKDSLGNDVTRPRYVKVRAEVAEVFQNKMARLSAVLEVFDARQVLLDGCDVNTQVVFENYASTFRGDHRALSEESARRIGNRPLPFPSDDDLLNQAAEKLKSNVRDELRQNKAIW